MKRFQLTVIPVAFALAVAGCAKSDHVPATPATVAPTVKTDVPKPDDEAEIREARGVVEVLRAGRTMARAG